MRSAMNTAFKRILCNKMVGIRVIEIVFCFNKPDYFRAIILLIRHFAVTEEHEVCFNYRY